MTIRCRWPYMMLALAVPASVLHADAPRKVTFTDVVPPSQTRNLVQNGSFAVGACGWASYGTGSILGDLSRLHGSMVTGAKSPHSSFLRIALGGNRTPVLFSEYGDSLVMRQAKVLAATRDWIPLRRGASYTLSCAMRAGRNGTGATLMAVLADPAEARWVRFKPHRSVSLGTAWRRYALTFRAAKPYGFVAVGPDAGATADVTDVQLEQADRATAFTPHAPVEVGVEPSRPHGIFTTNERPTIVLRASNHTRAPANTTVAFAVTDFDDRPATLPTVRLRVPPRSAITRAVALPRKWRGYFQVTCTCSAPAVAATGRLRIAIVPAPTRTGTVLGVNHAFVDSDLIRLARLGGVSWYRDWSVKWQDVEPARGKRNWRTCDAQIGRVLREGASVVPLLPPLPSARWASEAPLDMPTTGYQGERRRESWAPRNPADLSAFVSRAVTRYCDRVHVWEFLNEPLYTGYALPAKGVLPYPGPRYTAADYVALLRPVAAAMHRADPGCRVIGGAGSGPEHLTREMLDAGLLGAADVMNLHIYPGTRTPESFVPDMDALLRNMDAHGGRKPIWITEFSYYGADALPRRPFVAEPGDWSEERLLPDERTCAQYTVRFITLMLARGVEKVFLHSGLTGTLNMRAMECCLFADSSGAPCKVFPALAVLTELLGDHPRCVGERTLGGGAHAVSFETGSRSVIVLWSPDGQGAVANVRSRRVRCIDLMGRPLAPDAVRISPSPMYVTGRSGTAVALCDSITHITTAP